MDALPGDTSSKIRQGGIKLPTRTVGNQGHESIMPLRSDSRNLVVAACEPQAGPNLNNFHKQRRLNRSRSGVTSVLNLAALTVAAADGRQLPNLLDMRELDQLDSGTAGRPGARPPRAPN